MRIENLNLKTKIINQLGNEVFKNNSISNDNIKKIKSITIDTSNDSILSRDLELLPEIEELILTGNKLKEYRLNKIGKLNTLRIKTDTIENIPDLKKIKKLNDLSIEIEKSENSDKYLSEIEKLKKLNYLTLINFDVKSLSFLKNLSDLYKIKIQNSNKQEIKDLKSISKLYLESIFFNGMIIPNEDIKYLNNDAKELFLINCDIEDLSVFKNFKRLKTLDLSCNKITSSQLNNLVDLKDINPKLKTVLKDNDIENKNILKGLNMTEVETITNSKKPVLYSIDDFKYNVNLTDNLKYDLYLNKEEFMKFKFVENLCDKVNEITIDLKEQSLDNMVLNYAFTLKNINIILKLNDFTKITTEQLKALKKYRSNIKFNITENNLRKRELYNIDEFIEMYIKLCDIVNNAPKNLNDIEKVCFAYMFIGNNYKKTKLNRKHCNKNNRNLYSLFVQNKGSEDGIADILKLLLTALNIKTITIESTTVDGKIKTWNKVKIFNCWYNMDLDLDLIELEQGNTLKYFLRGEYDFNHENYKSDNNIRCNNYGMDLKVLINQLFLINKKITKPEKVSI